MSVTLIDDLIMTGPMVIDLDAKTVIVAGRDVVLTRREWDLLVYFARRVGKFRDVDDVFWCVFAPDMVVGRHRVDGIDSLVRTTLTRLRARLGVASSLLETRHGFGFRLRNVEPSEGTA